MTALEWGKAGEHYYGTGVDHGVLYPRSDAGEYDLAVAWSGLKAVTATPSGAESNKKYADNQVYLDIRSAEEFGGTIEAMWSPREFDECDGARALATGVRIGQQARRSFGFAYRTRIGNEIVGDTLGYEINLVYGATASPTEKANSTVNDSPEETPLSWEFSTIPVPVTVQPDGEELRPTSILTISSLDADPAKLAELEDILYGTESTDGRLPLPDEVYTLFDTGLTAVSLATGANQPSYNTGTHVVTLPTVTGVQWKINGVNKTPGAQPALTVGQVAEVTAHPTSGYTLTGDTDWTFEY